MTPNSMSCTAFNDCLMAYLEHETDDATRLAVERHAVTCGECGPLLADLRKLRVDAANLPELEPSHDMWARIAERIEAPVVAIGSGRSALPLSAQRMRRWPARALLAASLVAAAGIGYLAPRRDPSSIVVPVATTPQIADTGLRVAALPVPPGPEAASVVPRSVSQAPPAMQAPAARGAGARVTNAAFIAPRPMAIQLAAATVAGLTADYDREIAKLRTLIDQRRNQLDPATVAIIERNLAVIDTAIVECKKAIARDPASRFLIESLNQTLQSKMELMRTAALLPART